MQIAICGGGNAAHVLAGMLSTLPGNQISVYLSIEDEAIGWREGIAARGGITVQLADRSLLGCPQRVSSDPAQIVPDAELILLALPAFAHEAVLREIAPHVKSGVAIGALPARGCFDLCIQDVFMKDRVKVVIFGLQTLPWACRIQHYGQEVRILGTKSQVDLAARPKKWAVGLANTIGVMLGMAVVPSESFLSLTLAGTGQLIHPGIMYGLFHDWNGTFLAQAPLFYQGVDDFTSEILEFMSGEVQSIRSALECRFPGLDLSAVYPLHEWLGRSYADDIADRSSLRTAFVTNRSYAGLKAPVRQMKGGLAPDFQARYLSEDVPYSLIATRGIAELAGVATPAIDRVIYWAQAHMGKEYLTQGKLTGQDIDESRAPQRYGYPTIEELVESEISLVASENQAVK